MVGLNFDHSNEILKVKEFSFKIVFTNNWMDFQLKHFRKTK